MTTSDRPSRIVVMAAFAQSRVWFVWVGMAVGYMGVLLGVSLIAGSSETVPTGVTLAFASVVPTIWWAQRSGCVALSMRDEALFRFVGGIGFLILNMPLWMLAVRDASVVRVVTMLFWALMAAWAWSVVAARWIRSGGVCLLVTGLLLWPFVSRSLTDAQTVTSPLTWLNYLSTPYAFLSPSSYRWVHLVVLGIIGGVGWRHMDAARATPLIAR